MVLCKLTIPKQVSDLSYSIGKLVVCLHMSDRLNPSPPKKKRRKKPSLGPPPQCISGHEPPPIHWRTMDISVANHLFY